METKVMFTLKEIPEAFNFKLGDVVQNKESGQVYLVIGFTHRGNPLVQRLLTLTHRDEWLLVDEERKEPSYQ